MDLQQQLFYLRMAASYWLSEHPHDMNAPSVKEALKASEALAFPSVKEALKKSEALAFPCAPEKGGK